MNIQQSKKIKKMISLLVVMDNLYHSRDFDTIGKLSLNIDLQLWAIDLCSSWVPLADLKLM